MSSKKTVRKHSPEQKLMIVKRHLIDKVAVSDLCEEYHLQPSLFYKWQKELFDHGSLVFDRKQRAKQTAKLPEKVNTFELKLQEKNAVITELMQEHLTLKKHIGED